MTTAEPFDANDPFELHFHREPILDSGVSLLVLRSDAEADLDPAVWNASVEWLRSQERSLEIVVKLVDGSDPRLCELITSFLDDASQPTIAICKAAEPPSREQWEPLLKALDLADHVLGNRPAAMSAAIGRRLARVVRRVVLGVPLTDVYSPLSLHRAEKLREIPMQSGSSFIDVEILAKATFLGHILEEPCILPMRGTTWRRGWLRDLGTVFKRPAFRRPHEYSVDSRPLEHSQRQPESPDGPGGEDRQGACDLESPQAGPLQDDQTKAADQLGER
ncbi:hypothetical protein VT85_16800 [Planctomyces sp. SH-PL62]|nr:hypothetical protein VT85_16800 [Planctomyces sp. SH-PL62]